MDFSEAFAMHIDDAFALMTGSVAGRERGGDIELTRPRLRLHVPLPGDGCDLISEPS